MGQEVFYSFDEVLRELQVEKDELNRLIEEGEIKAYSQGGQIKFLKKDVDTLRFSKMEQPTIAVHDREEIEIVDDMEEEEIEKEDFFAKDWAKNLKNESASSLKHAERTSPLLNLSKEKENLFSFEDQDITEKEGTDELEFENIGGDDLMDTGELLFDIKDKKLPGDKEVEELFPEEESDSMEEDIQYHDEEISIPQGEIEEDEEIIGMSDGLEEKDLAFTSNKSHTWKIAGGVGGLVLAFSAVLALLFPEVLRNLISGVKEVPVYRVSSKEIENTYTFKNPMSPKVHAVHAQQSGKIVKLAQTGSLIEKESPIAYIAFPQSMKKEIEELQSEKETLNATFEANKASYRTLAAEEKKYLQANPVIVQYLDFQKRFKESPNDLYKQQMERIKKENPTAMKGYGPIFNKKKNLTAELKQQQAKLQDLTSQISQKEQEFQKANLSILSPEKGIIKEWKVQEGQEIEKNALLCNFESDSFFLVCFDIPKKDALAWEKGSKIELCQEDKKWEAIVEKAEEKNAGLISLEVSFHEEESQKDTAQDVSLVYSQKKSALVIPAQSLSPEGNFVLLVKENKIQKVSISIEKKLESSIVIQKGLVEGDSIVEKYDEALKDGDSIIAK
ncbi:MAG: hypothetical protein HUU50_13625 [Candidatus Brocadiae bacterium]|nr:hypothetical protein [Candidatus Brocadiia bacterium]